MRGLPKDEIDRRVRRSRPHSGPHGLTGEEAANAVGWPATARRNGPGDRPQPAGVPHGRAALEPRRQAPRRDARRDLAHPAGPRGDDGLRDARPGRGDDDGDRVAVMRGGLLQQVAAAEGALRAAAQSLRRRVHQLPGHEPRPRRRGQGKRHVWARFGEHRLRLSPTRRAATSGRASRGFRRDAPIILGYTAGGPGGCRRSARGLAPAAVSPAQCRHPGGHGLGGVRATSAASRGTGGARRRRRSRRVPSMPPRTRSRGSRPSRPEEPRSSLSGWRGVERDDAGAASARQGGARRWMSTRLHFFDPETGLSVDET